MFKAEGEGRKEGEKTNVERGGGKRRSAVGCVHSSLNARGSGSVAAEGVEVDLLSSVLIGTVEQKHAAHSPGKC